MVLFASRKISRKTVQPSQSFITRGMCVHAHTRTSASQKGFKFSSGLYSILTKMFRNPSEHRHKHSPAAGEALELLISPNQTNTMKMQCKCGM